jgi:hypothetical protein
MTEGLENGLDGLLVQLGLEEFASVGGAKARAIGRTGQTTAAAVREGEGALGSAGIGTEFRHEIAP